MVNSVLGKIDANNLGITLMHEHITWDRSGAESTNNYSVEEVVNTMLPYCNCNGISQEIFHKLLVENPIEVLNLD